MAYIAVAPERCLWATNWPFPDITTGEKKVPRPDTLPFLNLFGRWAPDEKLARNIGVKSGNALRLLGLAGTQP